MRPILLAFLASAVLAACSSGAPMAALAATGLRYDRPGKLVQLQQGRMLNMRCLGRGSPTVILESGFGATSQAWMHVQPVVAQVTRVCAYDRAGYGFSPPGPMPRDGAAIVRDLDQALAAAGMRGPYVLAGHSAGGLYMRLFAARHVSDVQGLVFVDATSERMGPRPPNWEDGLGGIRAKLKRCLAAAEAGAADTTTPQWSGCIPRKADAQAMKVATSPANWSNQLSELDEIFGRTSDQVGRIGDLLQHKPAYVLTAADTVANSVSFQGPQPRSIWLVLQQNLASRFEPGFQRTVLSSHLMVNDRPEVIADAIVAMVKAARAGKPPEPLAPSETADDPSADDPATTWSGGQGPR